MSEIETLAIIQQLQSLISDRLQLVSYKWLSRNFLVSSNVAKKLLQEFVEKHDHGLEVTYTIAGWLKSTPPTYHIRLVPALKLAEAKQDFDDNCSIQVYSVQPSIPKDPVSIWNAEFIQAEELFKQPPTVDNCLRDNRFCGVSNSYVKRNVEKETSAFAAPRAKSAGSPGLAAGITANQTVSVQPQQKKIQQASPKLAIHSPNSTLSGNETKGSSGCDLKNKETSVKERSCLPDTKKTGKSGKSSAAAGGSLTNLWNCAATKAKSTKSFPEEKIAAQKSNVTADAQISAREAVETVSTDDDDDESEVNFKRASTGDGGKKRRVVLDDSDEDDYENAVSLGSPDPPKGKPFHDSKQKSLASQIEKNTLNFNEQEGCKLAVKEENKVDVEVNDIIKKDSTAGNNERSTASETVPGKTAEVECIKNKGINKGPSSPKRRKVLKTRIDARGREVTEVVWEGEETHTKDANTGNNGVDCAKNSNGHSMKVEDNASTNPATRPANAKKSPASSVPSHVAGKPGSKKGASAKDPKQGNILSFFKKV